MEVEIAYNKQTKWFKDSKKKVQLKKITPIEDINVPVASTDVINIITIENASIAFKCLEEIDSPLS